MAASNPTPDSVAKLAPTGRERRSRTRYPVDAPATLFLLNSGSRLNGRLQDLSLGGCSVITEARFPAATLIRIEIEFEIQGIAFRSAGVVQGTRGKHGAAVRFTDLTSRRLEALSEIIADVAADNARKAAQAEAALAAAALAQNTASLPAATTPTTPRPVLVAPEGSSPLSPTIPDGDSGVAPATAQSTGATRERRNHERLEVDTHVELLLVNTAIRMTGKILDLSLAGCRIRTIERFNVGIYVRVEMEFYLNGTPFRLGGVSQTILDKHTLGIRFLDMSDRKREYLTELIAEIAAAREAGDLPPAEPE